MKITLIEGLMGKRDSHAGKSKMDKQIYHKYIEKIDCEPTLEEKLPFPHSDQEGEELSESTSKRERPIRWGISLRRHFEDRWPYWLVSVVIFAVCFFIFDAKVDIRQLNFVTTENKNEIVGIKTDIKSIQEVNHKQDLGIQETKIYLNVLRQTKDSDSSDIKKTDKKR